MTTDNQGVSREEKQRQIDIKNLRFYARLFLEHHWETLQISSGVFQQTLKEIADRLDSSEKDKADAVAAERERCAQKAKEQHCKHDCCHEGCGEAWKIESAIRSGK